jgi:tetratricopeptide (TPR) repeat protein
MEAFLSKPTLVVGLVAVLIAALVGVQGVATLAAPNDSVASAGRLLGDTGFAYLGGLRVFAAAVLWNRLEPQFDQFYQDKKLKDLTFLMPNLYLVQKLDPTFVQAYYNAAFILGRRGQWDEALRVAKEGIEKNPKSGLMRANYAQLLIMQDQKDNLPEAYRQALVGVGPDITYDTMDDEFESVAIFRVVFNLAGRKDLASAASRRLDALRSAGAEATGLSHDHDGDGSPDH